jgi:hypothetical protein
MRAPRGTATRRAPLTRRARRDGPLAARLHRVGWQAGGTPATPARLAGAAAVWGSGPAERRERRVPRLQRRGSRAPLLVQRADPRPGRTSLWTGGVRVCTARAWGLQRARAQAHATRPGRHPAPRPPLTDTPTAARRLHACAAGSRTLRTTAAGEALWHRLTPLSEWPQDLLHRLGVDTSLAPQLAMHDTGT